MHFEFSTAGRIVFGRGCLSRIGPLSASMGSKALVVTGRSSERAAPLTALLEKAGVGFTIFRVTGEPTVAMIEAGVLIAREARTDLVIGCGGGSVIDAGKALAVLLANPGETLDYLEIIGKGRPLAVPSFPFIAVPTTAGTGAEVTANAVLASPEHGVKVSLRSPSMLPRVALVDPELSASMPFSVTVATGLDALTQVIEPYVSRFASPLTDILCLDGITRAARALPRVCAEGHDMEAREEMALASLYGGLALANAKLGAVHGIAGPFGGMFSAPHGAVCAALLPLVMVANIRALQRLNRQETLARYATIARKLTGSIEAQPLDGPRWIATFCRNARIPGLATYGCTEGDIPQLAANAARASSMQGNAVELGLEAISEIIVQSL